MPMQIPISKFDSNLVNSQLSNPALTSHNRWDGPENSILPILEQFPDYDWAAGLEFSNSDFPPIPVGSMNPAMQQGNVANIGYTFG